MAAAANFPSAIPSQEVANLLMIPVSAGAGALAGRIFGLISPAGGAIFGASSGAASLITGLLVNQSDQKTSAAAKIVKVAIQLFASIATGIAVTTALGHPIAALTALKLHLASGLVVSGGVVALVVLVGAGVFIAKSCLVSKQQ
jgi:hypothetical protein